MTESKIYEALLNLTSIEKIADAGEIIFTQGVCPEVIVLLENGLFRTQPEFPLLTSTSRIYGLSEAYFGKPLKYTLSCQEECKLQIIPANECVDLFRNDAKLKITFMSWVAQSLNYFNLGLA